MTTPKERANAALKAFTEMTTKKPPNEEAVKNALRSFLVNAEWAARDAGGITPRPRRTYIDNHEDAWKQISSVVWSAVVNSYKPETIFQLVGSFTRKNFDYVLPEEILEADTKPDAA